MKSKKIIQGLAAVALFSGAAQVWAEVAVVVGASSAVSALTQDQVSQIFLGKASSYPDGGHAAPIDQVAGTPVRDAFYDKVAGKSAAQMKAYWSRLIFSGKGKPPEEKDGAAGVKEALGADSAAIGYLDASDVDASVKVVLKVQ